MKALAFGKQLESLNLQRFLKSNYIETAVRVLQILSIILCLVLLGLIISTFLENRLASSTKIETFLKTAETKPEEGEEAISRTAPNLQPISSKNIFGPLGIPTPIPPPNPVAPGAPAASLALVGTYIDGERSYAIIEDQRKKSQDAYFIGKEISAGIKLTAVLPDRVKIERDGKSEELTLRDAGARTFDFKNGVAQLQEEEFVVEEAELDRQLANLPMVLSEARAVPFFKEGKTIGLRLFAIKAGSLFERLGLKNGDVLKSVNNNSLSDLSQALRLFEQLKQEKSISVSLERNGMEKQFKYQIR